MHKIGGNMKKKIMHISQSNGGVARYLQMLLKFIDREKYEQILIYPRDYINEKNEFKNLVDKIEFVDIYREISLINDIRSIIQVYKVIKKYDPDLIYVHSSKAGAVGRLANIVIGKPIIYNPHGWAFNMNLSNMKRKVYIFIERLLSKFTDKIIVISNKENIVAKENNICRKNNKIEVIINGIDVEKYSNIKFDYSKFRKKLEIPEAVKVIGMVGRITFGKGPDVFVKVAEKISKIYKDCFFIIVGDGEERESIEKLIKEKNLREKFLITGWVDNVYEYINIFDIAMLLTRWEGFGLAIAEYMISGKPIITTNVGAVPELINNNQNGILVDINDSDDIVNKLIKLLEDDKLCESLSLNAKNRVIRNFDIRRVVIEHERVIDEILK